MRATQRGAALLVALLVAALVTVTLTVMLQRQSAIAGIEWQLRETAQARRILQGAEDWALLILREDARRSAIDHLGEPWAIPLAEGRLADFLKSSPDGTAGDLKHSRAEEVWLAGRIVDADARYNLTRLRVAGTTAAQERALWMRVAAQAELPPELAREVAVRFLPPAPEGTARPALPPLSLEHLKVQIPALSPWIARLSALVVILPESTTININTAPKAVLMALLPELDEARVERFMQQRLLAPWRDINSARAALGDGNLMIDPAQAGVTSRYFIINSKVRLGAGNMDDATRATEIGLTTIAECLAQENRVRVLRRDFGHIM